MRRALTLTLAAGAVATGALALAPGANAATLYSNLAGADSDSSGTGQLSGESYRLAQPFAASASGTARTVGFYGRSYLGQTANVSVSLYTDSGGSPGSLIATGAQATIDENSDIVPTCTALSGAFGEALPALTAGQTYWAVFQTYNNNAFWSAASQGGLQPKASTNSGASWATTTMAARSLLVDDAASCQPDIETNPQPSPNPNAELGDMYAKPGGTSFQTLQVSNRGVATLRLTGGSFSGQSPSSPAGMFTLLNGEPNAHPPGTAFTFPKDLGSSDVGTLMYIVCAPPANTPDGLYTATFTLTSNDPDEASLSWPVWCLLDSTPPSIEFTQNPNGRNGWFVTRPAPFQARGVDPESGDRVKHIFCTDNGSPTLDWPNSSIASFEIDAEGAHEVDCQATDVANNTSDAGKYKTTVKVDTVPPETAKGDGPPALSHAPSASFAFTGTDATSGVQEFECRLDGGPYEPCSSPAGRSGLGNGTHTFDVRARDTAGNYDPTPERWTWDVDVAPPEAADDQASATGDTPVDIDVVANDVDPFAVALHPVLGGASTEMGGAVSVVGSSVRYVAAAGFVGTDTFSYRAVNANGVTSAPATVTVQVAAAPAKPGGDGGACKTAKKKLAKAKAKLRKLERSDAPKKAISRAKAKVKKRHKAVKAACAGR